MTWDELRTGMYPPRAILSPTKLCHSILLYAGYGYFIVTTLVAVVSAALSWRFPLALLAGDAWLILGLIDSTLAQSSAAKKEASAHIPDWRPIWKQ